MVQLSVPLDCVIIGNIAARLNQITAAMGQAAVAATAIHNRLRM